MSIIPAFVIFVIVWFVAMVLGVFGVHSVAYAIKRDSIEHLFRGVILCLTANGFITLLVVVFCGLFIER